jgi:subtilisin family serine protease
VVNEETEFWGFSSLDELEGGDWVWVRGELNGTVITATRAELYDGCGDDDWGGGGHGGGGSGGGGDDGGDGGGEDDCDVDFESTGVLTELLPPDSFALSDQRVYRVDGETRFGERIVSYAGLSVGQFLEVMAVYEGGVYRVLWLEYQGERDEGQGYVELEGAVAEVTNTGLVMADGVEVLFIPSTVFNGDADRPEDIQPGWQVKIDALLNVANSYLALDVRAKDPAPPTTIGQEFEPREALLVLAERVEPQSVAARYSAEITGQITAGAVLFAWQTDIDDGLLADLAADPEVLAVEPNYLFRDPESVRRRFIVVDRAPTNGKYTNQVAAIRHKVAEALAIADGSGTVVAVMDTGVDKCHPLIRGRLIRGGLDLIEGDFAPWETNDGADQDDDGDVDEAAGHGTFVASIVALVAPGAKILPYRVLDDEGGGTAFELALALADAIERDVDVINMSLAYHRRSLVVDLLLEEASRQGIVLIAAAGNDQSSDLPFPASDSHVLAVTALRADGTGLADFSNRGAKSVLAITGEDVYGALYAGEYGTSSGTSMAAPFAAGGAALVKSLDPSVSADLVREVLVQTGLVISDGVWDGRSLDLGNVAAAVQP